MSWARTDDTWNRSCTKPTTTDRGAHTSTLPIPVHGFTSKQDVRLTLYYTAPRPVSEQAGHTEATQPRPLASAEDPWASGQQALDAAKLSPFPAHLRVVSRLSAGFMRASAQEES